MHLIKDKSNNTVAYLQHMIIFNVDKEEVIGILLGDCIFGKSEKIIGKIFKGHAHLLNGEIIGKIELDANEKNFNVKKSQLLSAWDILTNVKDHTPIWIEETKKWSKKDFLSFLV
jgi:hypothetical protein